MTNMNDKNLMPIPVEIRFDYDGPVSLDFFRDAISILCQAAEYATLDVLGNKELWPLDIKDAAFDQIKEQISEQSRDSFWLDTAEYGSITFKGRLLAGILSGLIVMVAHDIAKESEEYKEFTKAAAVRVDNYIGSFRSYLKSRVGDPTDPNTVLIETKIVGNCLHIHVVPNRRQSDITRLL